MTRRVMFFSYGLLCYVMFLGVFAYSAGFIGDLLVHKTIDSPVSSPASIAVAVNVLLLALFGLQHSVMARPTFKRWWTRFVPEPIERATYVLATNLVLVLFFWLWQPIPAVIWDAQQPTSRAILYGLYAVGWMVVFLATVLLNHFDLFGMRQVWLHLQGKPYTRLKFKLPLFYRHVRHPLYVGWIMTFWCIPTMTLGHLLFAVGATSYILIAIQFEERNLLDAHGKDYADYRRRVPMLIPRIRKLTEPDMKTTTVGA